jgi:uncharacterized protein (TIGR02246 family)
MSMRLPSLFLALWFFMAWGCATVSPEPRIRDLEQQQAKAAIARDRAALDRIFAPDFRIINPAGAVASKEELYALLLGGQVPAYRSAVYETQTVEVFGEVVVTTGLETVVMGQGAQAGQTVQRRITQVWEQSGRDWRLALRHATNVAPPAAPPAPR